MSALFQPKTKVDTAGKWAKIADRRSGPTAVRLRAGLFLSYHRATGAKEFDSFLRDSKTWAIFEHAALPELAKFTFFDKHRKAKVSEPAVLADAMYHLWSVSALGRDLDGRPTTIRVIGDLADYICQVYETEAIDRRAAKRNWFGLGSKR
jgi:hypothetical protein